MAVLRIPVVLAFVWAAVALTAQVLIARGGGRREFSRRAGRPLAGLLHNFTVAMLPGHKETARLHPGEFVVGVVLHLGVFATLAEVLVLLLATNVTGPWLIWLRWVSGSGAAAAVVLAGRRLRSPAMRALSTPDDYVAIVATCGLLVLGVFPALAGGAVLLGYTTVLLLYLPLGKLRHAVFFFVARADYGWRLGYRGVYPPATAAAPWGRARE